MLTPAVAALLARASKSLIGEAESDDYDGEIDLMNVALMIVGRSTHPFLQFLGDIVSSGFDADKLDYLLRDARTAGLPLTYDIDRYLYDVRVEEEALSDGEDQLQRLFALIGVSVKRHPKSGTIRFPYYETYRLRLSRRAMNVIEQMIICKMMLYSYIYHHGKVRAAEGLLERLLSRCLDGWRKLPETDDTILVRFLDMTNSCLRHSITSGAADLIAEDYAYRLVNRLVPREVYNISGPSATHAQGELIEEFLMSLHDRDRDKVISSLELAIGEELLRLQPDLGSTPAEATARAGVWVDAPNAPTFEDVDEMVVGTNPTTPTGAVMQIFPIREWIQAYEHYRYQVRIFSFSEYLDLAVIAAKAAMERNLDIASDSFYKNIRRIR